MLMLRLLLVGVLFSAMVHAARSDGGADGKDSDAGKKLTQRARALVTFLAKHDYTQASKYFDATMRAALPNDKLRQTWEGLLKQTGELKKQGATRTEQKGKYDIIYLTCEFARDTLDVKVVFNGKGEISGLFFVPPAKSSPAYQAPAYVRRDRFHDIEVTLGTAPWQLPGTLSMPVGAKRWPAVILVHGSGPEDRDETIGPNRPFRDLAWGLASRGIAVLRYEKRTKAYPGTIKDIKDFTVQQEVLDDVRAAADMLRQRQDIDSKKIFVAGHSLGGMLLPRIGAADPGLAGLIGLAGTTRQLDDVMIEQLDYILSLDPNMPAVQKEAIENLKKEVIELKAMKLGPDVPASKVVLHAPVSYWRDLRGYSPTAAAKHLTQPLLILQGERDYQVTMKDFDAWKAALAGRKNVTLKSYPSLNHLFVAGKGKSRPEEYSYPGHVAQEVVDDIAAWVKQMTG